MPRVSVIIPSYNCAEWVATAVQSALSQSMVDSEVIVIDDGSLDETPSVLQRFASNPRFRYIAQSNRGLPGARNAGVFASDSEFVAFLDADDMLYPDALEKMTHTLADTGSAWCLIDILKRSPREDQIQRCDMPLGDPQYAILRDDFIRRGMFFRRDRFVSVGMYDEAMKYREDWDLNIRMFAAGMACIYIPEPLYIYSWREGSITTGKRNQVLAYTEKVLRKHHKTLADLGDAEAGFIYSQLMWGLARNLLYDAHDFPGAMRCAQESISYNFSLSRLLHPISHNLQRLTSLLSNSPGR